MQTQTTQNPYSELITKGKIETAIINRSMDMTKARKNNWPNAEHDYLEVRIMWGRKYAKLFTTDGGAIIFISRETGDIYNADSWTKRNLVKTGNVLNPGGTA